MDFQQIAALSLVVAAAALLVRRYLTRRRSPKPGHCADCPAASSGHPPARPPSPRGG